MINFTRSFFFLETKEPLLCFIFLQGTYLLTFIDFAIRSTTWMALIGILRSVGDISGVSKKPNPKDSVIQYSMAVIMERDIQSEFCQALLFF